MERKQHLTKETIISNLQFLRKTQNLDDIRMLSLQQYSNKISRKTSVSYFITLAKKTTTNLKIMNKMK